MNKAKKSILGVGVAVSLAAGALFAAPSAAMAASEFGSDTPITCPTNRPAGYVESIAKGRVNHRAGVTTLGSWNNGSAYVRRTSWVGSRNIPGWRTWITGTGGDISNGYAGCSS